MKKIITICFVVSFICTFSQVATCTLDPSFIASNKDGIWPDSVTNFISGTVGQQYQQNLTIKVPKDTVTGFGTFCFNRIEVTSPNGVTNFNLPPGLNMLGGNNVTVTAGTFKFPGNDNTCALIQGTPAASGSYTLQFKVQPYVTPSAGSCQASPNTSGGNAITAPQTLVYYIININEAAGLKEMVNSKTFKLSNSPNPFSGKSNIKFYVQDQSIAKITVFNMLGSKILEDKIKTSPGENTFELNASDWNSGIYFYTFTYKNHSETRRMVINSLNE